MANRMTFRTYYDEERARHHIAWKYPTSVRAYTGEFFTHSFRKGVEPTRAMIREQIALYHARIFELSPIDGFIEGMEQFRERTQRERQRRDIEDAERGVRLSDIADRLKAIQERIDFRRDAEIMQAKYGISVPNPMAERALVPVSQALIDLKSHPRHRRGWRNERQEKKFDDAKLRAANSLFAFAGTDDMADPKINADLVQRWANTLDPKTSLPHDYVADVKALFNALVLKRTITDKARRAEIAEILKIPTPNRPPRKTRRIPFTDPKRVLEDARSREPVVRWLHWCSAFTGLMESEIVEAPASEIKFVDGRWWWYVGEDRELKTTNRPRVLLIHDALIREGFIDRVQSRAGKLLFDESAEQAVNKVRRHIRKQLGITDRRQVFYSHRHAFISALTNNKVELTLRKTLQGHGSQEIDFLHYIHHRQADLIAAIEGIEDPTE
jgi:hypothetical protein